MVEASLHFLTHGHGEVRELGLPGDLLLGLPQILVLQGFFSHGLRGTHAQLICFLDAIVDFKVALPH